MPQRQPEPARPLAESVKRVLPPNRTSARKLERLTQESDPYRWICGGVQINYHSLSDFRSDNGDALDGVLTGNLACLMAAGVVKLKAVAQDGMRVRAGAGAASFRRKGRLEDYLEVARERVQILKQQIEDDPGQDDRRQRAARERAVREREERVSAALAHNLMRMIELARA